MHTNSATLEFVPAIASLARVAEPDAIHACRILIIDDEQTNVRLLERILTREGFYNFRSTTDPGQASALFTDFEPDLVLTDWLMPGKDGCAVIGELRALMATDDYLPIVVLTADVSSYTKETALRAEATDFLTKPFDQTEVMLRVKNLLRARLCHLNTAKQNTLLEESVRRRTIELERAMVDLQRSQKQVIQQERLAALGTMAGGIAHDFNNAISIITGFGEVLLHDAANGLTKEGVTEPLTAMLAAAEDAGKIVDRLRQFYHPDEGNEEHQPVDLNSLVEQAVALTRPRWHAGAGVRRGVIEIRTDLGYVSSVSGAAAELREMLTNLIFNSVDALPDGGVITIATRLEGGCVLLKVSDTGVGMTEEVRERCLEPFFTTKGEGGTGLGLAMVFGIVQRHKGTIEIESEPDRGTIFSFRLPSAGSEKVVPMDALVQPDGALRLQLLNNPPIFSELVL